MLYFKTIRLHPTMFDLDIVSCVDNEQITDFIKKRYDLLDHEIELDSEDFACMIKCGKDAEIGDMKRMFVRLNSPNDREAIVHELVHVLHIMSEYTGIEVNSESQEWQACFTEMIFREACKPNYQKIPKKK